MIGVRQRQEEVTHPQPICEEEQRDEKHRKQVDEDREDVARKRGGALERTVEERVSEPRQLLLERRQRRKVGPKLGVRLTDTLVAVGVLRRAVGELDHLVEKRGHHDPADADDDREARDVDHHRGQSERQAKAPVKPLARPVSAAEKSTLTNKTSRTWRTMNRRTTAATVKMANSKPR